MTPDSEAIRCLWALYGAPREDLERIEADNEKRALDRLAEQLRGAA